MFDPGVVHLIDGSNIDRPTNAITLTTHFHQLFGDFNIYFEPTTQTLHTYKIISTQSHNIFREAILPVTRTLHLTDNHTIDPPSPRLFAIHRAIALILHLSAAGGYIDDILRDLDELDVKTDGSTELGRLIELRLGGWWNGVVRVY
jgi:HNH endonuclease